MARILAISSQVVFGPVGLSAIVPALQAQGHEVLAVPTVLLSNHPGHGKPAGGEVDIAPLFSALKTIGALKKIDAVITGYFSSEVQVASAAGLIKSLKPKTVLIDPVIGDEGRLYVKEEVANAIKSKLVPFADIVTPNAFELSWLTGMPCHSVKDARLASHALEVPEVIVTSVPSNRKLATLRINGKRMQEVETLKRKSVPNGTGDYLSGLYLGRLLKQSGSGAFSSAVKALEAAIRRSAGTAVLQVS